MEAKCSLCGKSYVMGENGTVDGCDACLGVERDILGHAWFPDEMEHVYQDTLTGIEFTVTREDAFRVPKEPYIFLGDMNVEESE